MPRQAQKPSNQLQGLELTPSRANMATALEEPMRTITGLCFIALTMTATAARAQGLFLEKGQPGISAAAGAATIGNAWTASVVPCFTYRGVFDVGLEATRYQFTGGDTNHLWAIGAMPFATAYLARGENGPLPISISTTVGVQKRIFFGNGGSVNPDGWGLLIGGSAFRRIDFSNTFVAIPELFVAYDMQSLTFHSSTLDSKAGARPGQQTTYAHKARLVARANLGFKSDKTMYTVVPYVGYQNGLMLGASVGAIF
jgi:hypothetical protein